MTKIKKIVAVLSAFCMSACMLSLLAACNNNSGTTNPPSLQAPSENGGGGGGGGQMGQQPSGEVVAEKDLPEGYIDFASVSIEELDKAYEVTFSDGFVVEWESTAAGSFMLSVYDQNASDASDYRSIVYYVKEDDGDWKKFTTNAMGPIGTGLNPGKADVKYSIIVEVPDSDNVTFDSVKISANAQGGGGGGQGGPMSGGQDGGAH